MKKKKIERGYSTMQVVIASLGFGACSVFWAIYNSYVPLILDAKLNDLGNVVLSATLISTLTGTIMSIDNFFGLVFQPIFGRKSDNTRSRWGKRLPYLLIGIPVCALLFILVPIAGRIYGVTGILVMMAVIIAFNFVMSTWRAPCVAIMPDMVPPKYQSQGNSIVNLVMVVVGVISMSAATILGMMGYKDAIAGGDYLSVFVFGSVVALVFLVVIFVFVKWPDNRGEPKAERVAENGKKESVLSLNLPKEVKRSMLFMMLMLFLNSGSGDGANTYNTLYTTKTLNMDVATVTMLTSICSMGAVAMAVPAGWLGGKIGRIKTISIGVSVCLVARVGMVFLHLAGNYVYAAYAVLNTVYYGAAMLVNINTLPVMLAIGGKDNFGAFTGYYYTATMSAAIVFPTIFGFFIGITGTYVTAQVIPVIAMFIGLICLRFVKHGEANPEDEAAIQEAVKAANDD